jgi:hypothetical protein
MRDSKRYIIILILTMMLIPTSGFALADVGEGTVVETRVSASSDDAEERPSGSVNYTSTDLELVTDGSKVQVVGLRFNGIIIPQGAVITNAYVQFTADETNSGSMTILIQGEAFDNAATFASVNANISSRALTTAGVEWSALVWDVVKAAGLDQRTPDLSEVVQEIVDRPGWASGNSLVIIMTGIVERTA